MVSKKRQAMRDKLRSRTEQSEKTRKDSGRFGSFFKQDIPDDVQFWNCGKGDHLIDIIPYEAGEHDPSPDTNEGDPTYLLDIFVHGGVGVNEDQVICPARTYKLPCPICEHQKELRAEDDYDDDLVKSLNPVRRVVYNIVCYDTDKDEDKGVQIWSVAHWHFEKFLTSLARNSRTGELETFADLDEGKSIAFEREGTGFKNTSYIGHKFEDRPEPIPEEFEKQAFCLDELIELKSYDEIYKLYWQEEVPEQEEGDKQEEEKSSRRGSRRQRPAEDKPKVKDDECPHGGEFGKDLGELNECGNCEVFEPCSKKKEEIEATGKGKEKEKKEETTSGRSLRRRRK